MNARPRSRTDLPAPRHATRPFTRRRGGVGILLAAAVAMGALTYVSFSLMPAPTSGSSSESSTSTVKPASIANRWLAVGAMRKARTEDNQQLVRALALAGVTPETLAAAGVAAESVPAVVANARDYLAEHGTALWAAMADHRAAVADRAAKERKVVAGIATENEKTAADTACSTLAGACSAQDSALNALYAAAAATLNNDQKAALAALRANTGRQFDLKYLAAARTQDQWVALRDALSNTHAAAKTGDEADPTAAALIAATDEEPAVNAADDGLSNSLPAINTAWIEAVAG